MTGGGPQKYFFFRLPLHPLEPLTQNVCYIIIIFVCWCLCLGREGWWPIYQQSVLLMDPFFAPQSPQGIPQKNAFVDMSANGVGGVELMHESLYHKLHKGTKKKKPLDDMFTGVHIKKNPFADMSANEVGWSWWIYSLCHNLHKGKHKNMFLADAIGARKILSWNKNLHRGT